MYNLEELLKLVDERVEKPLVTARFGDNWKNHVKSEYEKGTGLYELDDIIDIAWKEGRRAILLERALKELLG